MFMSQLESNNGGTNLFSGSSTNKKLGFGISRDTGVDSVEAATLSFMDIGTTADDTQLKTGTTKQIIPFDTGEFYWRTPINGVWVGTQANGKFAVSN